MNIEPIPAFNDNYIWLISDEDQRAFVVDPGDAGPVATALADRGLTLSGILITHHHPDHIGGLVGLKQQTGCTVWGPDNPAIDGIDHRVSEGDRVSVLGQEFLVLEVPGHTLDHIAFWSNGSLFCGDTLFVGGCGRVFEGTFPMMRRSLEKLRGLPDATDIYCAHEYTLANLEFAIAAEPDNAALQKRLEYSRSLRRDGTPTVPSTIASEKATNPFLRWDADSLLASLAAQGRLDGPDPDMAFATLRQWKDTF